MSAQKRISTFSVRTPRGRKGKEEAEEESDDSLIGEHSPFVRQPVKRYFIVAHNLLEINCCFFLSLSNVYT